jgi:hypothetical protein
MLRPRLHESKSANREDLQIVSFRLRQWTVGSLIGPRDERARGGKHRLSPGIASQQVANSTIGVLMDPTKEKIERLLYYFIATDRQY